MISIMTETVRNVQIIDGAVARWDRRRTDSVRDAYVRLIELEERETGAPTNPKGHVRWLDGIACGVGIRVVEKTILHRVLNEAETLASCDDVCADVDGTCISSFDPAQHFVVVSQPSVLSYLAEPLAARAKEFGENAMAVSPTFKCSVLWWNV